MYKSVENQNIDFQVVSTKVIKDHSVAKLNLSVSTEKGKGKISYSSKVSTDVIVQNEQVSVW